MRVRVGNMGVRLGFVRVDRFGQIRSGSVRFGRIVNLVRIGQVVHAELVTC